MVAKYKLHEISEFERERYRLKIEQEIETLNEIQGVIEESFFDPSENSEGFYEQKAKAFRLRSHLEHQREMISIAQPLKMLSLDLKQLKQLDRKLKKRLVTLVQSDDLKEKILFLQHKIEEEIAQEEMEQKEGFKSFFITLDELEILNELKVV